MYKFPVKYAIPVKIIEIIDTAVDLDGTVYKGVDTDISVEIANQKVSGFLPEAASDYERFKDSVGKVVKLVPFLFIATVKKAKIGKAFSNTSSINFNLKGKVLEVNKKDGFLQVDCGFKLLVEHNSKKPLKVGDVVSAKGRLDFYWP